VYLGEMKHILAQKLEHGSLLITGIR
jgi:hypothetical protein